MMMYNSKAVGSGGMIAVSPAWYTLPQQQQLLLDVAVLMDMFCAGEEQRLFRCRVLYIWNAAGQEEGGI